MNNGSNYTLNYIIKSKFKFLLGYLSGNFLNYFPKYFLNLSLQVSRWALKIVVMTREQGTPEEVLGYFTFRYIFRFFSVHLLNGTQLITQLIFLFPVPCSLSPIYRLDNTSLAVANVCSMSSGVCAKEVNPASN
jgi:hypothetical protein